MQNSGEFGNVGYRRAYKMRRAVKNTKYIIIGMPYEVIEREANIRAMTIDDFLSKFIAVAEYDGIPGVLYTFKEAGN